MAVAVSSQAGHVCVCARGAEISRGALRVVPTVLHIVIIQSMGAQIIAAERSCVKEVPAESAELGSVHSVTNCFWSAETRPLEQARWSGKAALLGDDVPL